MNNGALSTKARIEEALRSLVGLKLSSTHRAADMRIFSFGEITTSDIGGTRAKYGLHVQCPWRIDGPDGIITGRRDLWDHISGKLMPDDWEPQRNDNVQDV